MSDLDQLMQKALIASGEVIETLPTDERKAMQRRIKNQRRELRRLNANLRAMNRLVSIYSKQESLTWANAYRHAAVLAETFLINGKRIGAYIWKWI